MMRVLILIPVLLPLAACGARDKSGKAPVALPRIQVDDTAFELDGLRLYPGTTIQSLATVGYDAQGRAKSQHDVKVRFDSPAPPETVRNWIEAKLAHSGRPLKRDGAGLIGEGEEGEPFRLQLAPAGAGHSEGTITVGN